MALSRAPLGLEAPQVRAEVHLGPGLPAFALVGLPEAVVRESKERVRSALLTTGFEFPAGRITVNLSPADLPKEGGRFDLPIAVGILAASRELPARLLKGREFYGELSLGGELRQTPKLLPALLAGSRTGRELILPFANALEAALVPDAKVRLAGHLRQVCDALSGNAAWSEASPAACTACTDLARPADAPDLSEVRGQFAAKRALEIAAAGEHGLLIAFAMDPSKFLF
jgi:magnesium chelatase family protein